MYGEAGLTGLCKLNTFPQIHPITHHELSAQGASTTCRSWKTALHKKNLPIRCLNPMKAQVPAPTRKGTPARPEHRPTWTTPLTPPAPSQGCLVPSRGHPDLLALQRLSQSFRTRLCFKWSAGISDASNPNHRTEFTFFMHMILQALKQTEIKLFL